MTDMLSIGAGITGTVGLAISLACLITGSVVTFQGHEYVMIGGGLGSLVITAVVLIILGRAMREEEQPAIPQDNLSQTECNEGIPFYDTIVVNGKPQWKPAS